VTSRASGYGVRPGAAARFPSMSALAPTEFVLLTLTDWFCGAGGATQGAALVPGVQPIMASNHDQLAIETHSRNFPDVEHFQGDIQDLDVATHPYSDLFWASPECTNWSRAKGKARDYTTGQLDLFGDPGPAEDVVRSRALMQDVIRYLRGMHTRRQPVAAGIVENVIDIRDWTHWSAWVREIQVLGYRTRLIALNSMHAQGTRTPRAPQSRDRLYLAYWHEQLGRDPDWDRWLRPPAHCPVCDQDVAAVQTWKRPGVDMGRYRQQYLYRCPHLHPGRPRVEVEPYFVPAAAAIDWTLPGQRIGDKPLKEFFDKHTGASLGFHPLAPNTLARIQSGIRRYARPLLSPAGGTWNDTATPVDRPTRARTTREAEALVVPPLLVPVEGRGGKRAAPVMSWARTQTTRNETGLCVPPFIAELRGGGSDARPVHQALATVTASGNHHALITQAWGAIYAFDSGALRDHHRTPLPTQTTVEGDAVVTGQLALPAVADCLFRMLEPHEIHAGMAFAPGYVVLGTKRERVRQLGNAVTPPAAEVLISALVECVTGEQLDSARVA